MLPYDWSSMVDTKSGFQEKRKVAKPELWFYVNLVKINLILP